MLKRLLIRNVALIERAELEFSEGLNVLTGETGSGKSVILDSIDFVLGAKADKGMVRTGEEFCTVQAEFSAPAGMDGLLEELGVEPEDTLVISRKLTKEGKGSLKLNGMSVTAAMLRRVTSLLVDVHGQSEHFFLLKESNQLKLLDAMAGEPVAASKARVHDLLETRKKILSDLALLGGDEGERSRRMDILRFQIDEIARADLQEGEEEELTVRRDRFRNAERILEGLRSARDSLLADGQGSDSVRSAHRAVSAIVRYENSCAALAERLENAAAELEDIAGCIDDLAGEMEMDEGEAERVEARLDEIKTLKKKYGGSYSQIMEFYENAVKEYDLLESSAERREKLSAKLKRTDGALYAACKELTAARKTAASSFTGRVVGELRSLNIPSAKFEIDFGEYTEEDVPTATREGLDRVKFLFSANAGEPLKELGKIISGGEMSRFMLAVKAQLRTGVVGTYIFDEIDAGIGGKTARSIAEKFAVIAKDVQIIAVTHLARIASFADREFVIEKAEEGAKTLTHIREVEGEERLKELARLIGGTESEHVLAHAGDLLAEADAYKNSL